MSASHGRESLRAALAASIGLALGLMAPLGTARACHIAHHDLPQSSAATSTHSAAELPGPGFDQPGAPSLTPTALASKPGPIVPIDVAAPPASGTPATPPTVPNWNPPHCGCAPPPPPCSRTVPIPIPVATPIGVPPVNPPAAQQLTPTPEPSTIVSALALAGAFAWARRRGSRARA